jgi:hypothetical protein
VCSLIPLRLVRIKCSICCVYCWCCPLLNLLNLVMLVLIVMKLFMLVILFMLVMVVMLRKYNSGRLWSYVIVGTMQYCPVLIVKTIHYYLNQRHACSGAHAHLCALSINPLKLMLQIVRQQKIDRRTIMHQSDYGFSCPCNKEPPSTHKPLQRGG